MIELTFRKQMEIGKNRSLPPRIIIQKINYHLIKEKN